MKSESKPKPVSKLKKQLDQIFSKYIRYRDSKFINGQWVGPCITCKKLIPYKLAQAGHFQSRRHNSTRFDEQNVNLQCQGCNMFNQGEQYKHGKAINKKFGAGTAELLELKARQTLKLKDWYLEELLIKYKQLVKEFESHEKPHTSKQSDRGDK